MIRPRRRPAFTLIELLVVIAIIGVLIALLLPAVQAAREAARRTQCVNNLAQLGLALINYQSHHEVLPPGCVDTAGPILDQPRGYHFGWAAQLLPFIEQQAVYHNLNFKISLYDGANNTARGIQINSLLCPSDPNARSSNANAGLSNYAACHHDVEAPIAADNHGLMYLNSSVRTEDIDDGSTQTILLGEKVVEDDLGWASGTRATLRNTGTPLNQGAMRFRFAPGGPTPPATTPPSPAFVGGFSSRHPGGANFAMADGSVRFLKDSLTPRVYQALGNRSDGEMISSDEY